MEFDREHWKRDPASGWLVRLIDDHVVAGIIVRADATVVEVRSGGATTWLDPQQVSWIRPLIAAEADGWEVLAGFQAEDTTFDTWWHRGRTWYRITYSGPSGFCDPYEPIHPAVSGMEPPSPAALAQARPQIARALEERRSVPVPPIAHLQ
jgi:hypothetical protein